MSSETLSKKPKKSILKKLVIVFGTLFTLCLLAAVILPQIIKVDKYRPMIVEKANNYLNGSLELGHLDLSLWGRIKVNIDGIKIIDNKGTAVLLVKEAGFNVPWTSIISGAPELRLVMNRPEINVIKSKDGKMNLMGLYKAPAEPLKESGSQSQTSKSEKPQSTTPVSEQSAPSVPAIVLKSKLTFLLQKAKVTYKDEITSDLFKIDDLNFSLREVSPTSTIPFEVSAFIDIVSQKNIKVKGPLVVKGKVKMQSSAQKLGEDFDSADAELSVDLDDLEINNPGVFHKKKGTDLSLEVKAKAKKELFQIPTLKLKLASIVLTGQGSGELLPQGKQKVDIKISTAQIDLSKLTELSEMARTYNLNGFLDLSAKVSGLSTNLEYGADIKLSKMTLSHETLKQALEVNASIQISTNQVKDLTASLTAKNFDLSVKGNLANFAAPKLNFNVTSTGMDLDGLLKASEKAAQARKDNDSKQASGGGSSPVAGGSSSAPVVDYNAMFTPLRENKTLASASGVLDFSIKKLKSTGITIDDIQGQVSLNQLLINLKDFSMRIFDGSIKGAMSFNARSPKPEVGTKLLVAGLNSQRMVESHMPFARNTVKGIISADVNIGGSGLNINEITSGWHGNGKLDLRNAIFSTLDIGNKIKEGVITKLPEFAKDKVHIPPNLADWRGEYETVNMKFALENGTFNINEINGKAYPNKGLDLKGNGNVKLSNYGLDLGIDFIDTYNWFKLDEIAKDDRYGHFALSPKVSGTLFAPHFEWGATLSKLAQNALKHKGKQELQRALNDKLGNKLKEKMGNPQDALKGLKGIFKR